MKKENCLLNENIDCLLTALEYAGIGVWQWNILTNEVKCSETQYQMLGYTDQTAPRNANEWFNAFHPEDKKNTLRKIKHNIKNADKFSIQFRMKHLNGNDVWVTVGGKVIRDSNGKPTSVIGANVDISESMQTSRTIRDQEVKIMHDAHLKNLTAMSSEVSHEINNPLAIIHGTSEMLIRKYPLPQDKFVEYIQKIMDASTRISNIIKKMKTSEDELIPRPEIKRENKNDNKGDVAMNEMECVLIVDDEKDIQDILAEVCERNRIPYVTASSGNEAFKIIQERPITMILSDLNMPDGSGHELLQKIRQKGLSIPVAFLTAYDTKSHIHQSLILGATEFIAKPFNIDYLEATLFKMIDLGKTLSSSGDRFLRKKALFEGAVSKKYQGNQ